MRKFRSTRLLVAIFVALAMTITGASRPAQAAEVGEWVKGDWGQVRLSSIAGNKRAYAAGEVLRLALRVEANLPEVTDMSVTSSTVSGAEFCNWKNLPKGSGGKYNCGYIASQPKEITYTITEEDVAAGSATFETTWQPTGRDTGTVYEPITVSITVQTGEEPPFVWEDLVEGVPRTLANPADFGFTCHRIPALTEAPNGWILAAWDGRPTNCADAPQHNSIIQRVSKDGGKSWEQPTTIAAGAFDAPGGKIGYSDPSYVVDRVTGKIFAFFLKSYDQGLMGSVVGVDPTDRNVLHAVVAESADNGQTWTAPRDITADITPDVAKWRSRFAASGEGIQLRYGAHKGRLLQQYTMVRASDGAFQAVTVYSDDHGATWQSGQAVGTGMDENKVVELSDGTVMLNSRRSDAVGGRKVALSRDGGQTYGDVTVDEALVDPRNNASIIRAFPDAPEGSAAAKILLFSNANSASSRVNGTIRLSYDDGKSWPVSKVFAAGSTSYSTLTPLSKPGTYGLLYEGDGPSLQYMQISLDWLGVPSVQPTPTMPAPVPTVTATVTHNVPDPAVTATATVTVTNNVPGPTVTVTNNVPAATATITNNVPGPTVTVTNKVPGPTVTQTVHVPGPTATVTNNVPGPAVTQTVHAMGPTPDSQPAAGPKVSGAIEVAWRNAGAESGAFGKPLSEEIALGGNRVVQHFTGGDAYWAPGAGAWFVYRGNKVEWERLGGINGLLGAPTGNEVPLGGHVVMQTFQHGRIYWSPQYGARAVHGGLLARFLAAGGHEVVGVPITGEYPAGDGVRQDFANRQIQWP